MGQKQDMPQRRSIRLPDYDYAQPGAYFVTIVAHQHLCIFGKITDGRVDLSDIGKIVEETWHEIPEHFPNVINEPVVIMPNHMHGVIVIQGQSSRATRGSPLRNDPAALGVIIGAFKSTVTRKIRRIKGYEHYQVWQRNYYEHVIRDEADFQRALDYIEANPQNWENDPQYHTP